MTRAKRWQRSMQCVEPRPVVNVTADTPVTRHTTPEELLAICQAKHQRRELEPHSQSTPTGEI